MAGEGAIGRAASISGWFGKGFEARRPPQYASDRLLRRVAVGATELELYRVAT